MSALARLSCSALTFATLEISSGRSGSYGRGQAAKVDAMLLDCVKLEDIQLEFTNSEGEQVKRWRSTILSQAIHHATEHRAQIASALEAKGFTPVNLDDLDLWSYEKSQG